MTSVNTQRLRNSRSGASIKIACAAASTGNLTLSGEQTVDGIALVDGDRCFAKDQTDTTEIGIYIVSTGTWTRATDFDGSYDVVEGTIVPVSRGTVNAKQTFRITNTGTITVGTTAITLEEFSYVLTDNLVVTGSFTSPGIDDNANAIAITIDSDEKVTIANTASTNFIVQRTDGVATAQLLSSLTNSAQLTFANVTTGTHSKITADNDGELNFYTDGGVTTAFTLDNSNNATFAGNIVGSAGNEVDSGLFAIKASDESVTSSDTLQDDDDLKVTLAANSTYDIEVMFHAFSASSTPDIKYAFIEPDGTFVSTTHVPSSPDSIGMDEANNSGTAVALTLNINYLFITRIIAQTAGTGGVFKLQWAQSTSDGTATTVKTGSWMKATKLA